MRMQRHSESTPILFIVDHHVEMDHGLPSSILVLSLAFVFLFAIDPIDRALYVRMLDTLASAALAQHGP